MNRDIEIKMKDKKSFVVPGHQRVKKDDAISWKMKDTSAIFFFPQKKLFGKSEYRVKKGETLSLTVSPKAEKGRYPYAVFTDNNDFAEGGSFPELIVQ